MEAPIVYYTPTIAPAGIAFYTGTRYPGWRNNLFVSGLGGQQLRRLEVAVRQGDRAGDRVRSVRPRARCGAGPGRSTSTSRCSCPGQSLSQSHTGNRDSSGAGAVTLEDQDVTHRSAIAVLVAAMSAAVGSRVAESRGLAACPSWPIPTARPCSPPRSRTRRSSVPPGYRAELVASEPLDRIPIVDRLRRRRPDVGARDARVSPWTSRCATRAIRSVASSCSRTPNDDGGWTSARCSPTGSCCRARSRRSIGGVLIGEPPNLWLMKDTNGDLKVDTKELVSNTLRPREANIEHNANGLFWATGQLDRTRPSTTGTCG